MWKIKGTDIDIKTLINIVVLSHLKSLPLKLETNICNGSENRPQTKEYNQIWFSSFRPNLIGNLTLKPIALVIIINVSQATMLETL